MDKESKIKKYQEELVSLRPDLLKAANELLPIRYAYETACSNFERAFRKRENLQFAYDKVDRKLAALDGRTKVIKQGRSGKSKPKGGGTLDLTAYTAALTQDQREEFIQNLLEL